MKILVVSENFASGGLETQIKTMYDNLPDNIQMVFAFANYSKQVVLSHAKVYDGFHFSFASTIKEFVNDVNRLVEIIEKEKIDVIHVHPYYSFFPALFASQITKVKLIYTYHGYSSFNFNKAVNGSILYYYSIENNNISKIFAVNVNGVNAFKQLNYNEVILLPNPIDLKVFKKSDYVDNGHWVLISRLDIDKIHEIEQLIKNMSDYGIKKIDIYGTGQKVDELLKFIDDNNLQKKIFYKGYSSNVYKTITDNHNGVIGIGRVVIESLAIGYPTLLIGYNKITGFIDNEIYNDLKEYNFVNSNYSKVNYTIPDKHIIKRINKDVINRHDVNSVISLYINSIIQSKNVFLNNYTDLFDEIVKISEKNELSNCLFFKERVIYILLKKYIVANSSLMLMDNLVSIADLSYELYDNVILKIQKMEGSKK